MYRSQNYYKNEHGVQCKRALHNITVLKIKNRFILSICVLSNPQYP